MISKSLSRYLVVQATYNQSFGFDKKKIEVAVNFNDSNYSSYVNCPKYKYKSYL